MELGPSGFSDCPVLHDKENIVVCSEPKSELMNEKIIKQCEFYFSDANILKDQYLLNLVKSSKDGWVDLSVIASFKKLQSLTTDLSVIRQSLTASTKIEVSEDGNTIRRVDPLPTWDKSVYYRTIILSEFPENSNVTVESIQEFFTTNGHPPSLVRVLFPNRKIPSDLKRSQILHSQLGVKICAVVEFPNRPDALKAINLSRSHWGKIYAYLLCHGNKKLNKNQPEHKTVPNTTNPKDVADDKVDPIRKPFLRRLDCLSNNSIHVSHVREPIGPPTEESTGFSPGWRELLRLQRMLIRDGAKVNNSSEAELQPLDNAIVCIDSGAVCAS